MFTRKRHIHEISKILAQPASSFFADEVVLVCPEVKKKSGGLLCLCLPSHGSSDGCKAPPM